MLASPIGPAFRIGIDIGGTFTDIVVYDATRGTSAAHKELTTPEAPHRGVITGIQKLFGAEGIACKDVSRVVHATTLFTNALIERKGAPTGLITTAGFRDTLELRREHKYELYNLFMELPRPLVRRSLRLEAPERIGPDGKIEQPLDVGALLAATAKRAIRPVCLFGQRRLLGRNWMPLVAVRLTTVSVVTTFSPGGCRCMTTRLKNTS